MARLPASTREIGFVNPYSGMLSGWAQWDTFEQVPELIWPNSVRMFTRMSREDGRIASVLAAIALPVRRTAWRIAQNGASDEVTEFVARNLGLPILGGDEEDMPTQRSKDRFSWSEHLRVALLMNIYGHSVFEQVYRVDGDRLVLRKLAPRPSQTIAYWDVARDGGLNGIQQYPEGSITGAGGAGGNVIYAGRIGDLIPVNRLVAYVRDPDPGVWVGNALALDTPVPTPDGWRTMGELKVGDKVFDERGAVVSVVGTQRWENRPCREIEFDSGERVVADDNHRWLSHVRVGQKRVPKIVTTAEMAATLRKYDTVNHAIPRTQALDLPKAELPVDPYVLGYWLGDGTRGSGRLVTEDDEVIAEVERRGYIVRRQLPHGHRVYRVNGLTAQLRTLNLIENKHVPAAYLRASATQRLDLLRGLMDSDGYANAFGQAEFCNTDRGLVDAVVELAASLGARTRVQYVKQSGAVATMRDGRTINSRKDIYRVKFTAPFVAFGLERKAKLQNVAQAQKRPYHYVRSMEFAATQDTVCIEVDSPSHLYLCGNGMIPTHNSILRPSYKHWLVKDELIRIQAATARRNGMGVPVVNVGDAESQDPERIKYYQGLASAYKGGNTAGVSLPFGTDIKLLGVNGNLPADIPYMIEYHDKQMALAGLAHFLNLDKGGSYALASVQADTFTQSVQTVADTIRDTAQAHIVEDLVDINWGPDEPAPLLTVDEIGSRQDATAAALQMLVTAGLLTPDPRLEAFERQTLGLPPVDPDAPITEEPAETDPPAGAVPPVPESATPAALIYVREHTRKRSQSASRRRSSAAAPQQIEMEF